MWGDSTLLRRRWEREDVGVKGTSGEEEMCRRACVEISWLVTGGAAEISMASKEVTCPRVLAGH